MSKEVKMKIRTKLVIDIETDVNDSISNEETLRFLVEEDLINLEYILHSCELINKINGGSHE